MVCRVYWRCVYLCEQDHVLQDELAQKESQRAKQKAQSKQATVRRVLEEQLSQIQQEKNAARELKKKEAAELKASIRQYEEEEFQKWQQHKQQQAKTKQMYSEQVTLSSGRSVTSRNAWCMPNIRFLPLPCFLPTWQSCRIGTTPSCTHMFCSESGIWLHGNSGCLAAPSGT